MKLIFNENISLSLNKGMIDILYQSIEEVIEYWPLGLDVMNSLRKNCGYDDFIGFVKCHTWDPEEEDYDFVPVYGEEEKTGDFRTLKDRINIYKGFVIKSDSERDFRSKMMDIDEGKIFGFVKLKDF
jgi:hypothetical protein